jgi:hypothetical protein
MRRATAIALAAVLLALAPLGAGAWGRGGPGGGGEGSASAPRLPADFPAAVALPAGTLQAASGGAGRWSVLLLVRGSSATVQRATKRFYLHRGFRSAGAAVVRRGTLRVTIAAAARDHSPRSTNLTLGVTRGR